jgi:hypothetical protein
VNAQKKANASEVEIHHCAQRFSNRYSPERSNAPEERIEEHDLRKRLVSKAADRIGSRAGRRTDGRVRCLLVPLLAGGVPDLGLDAPVVDDEGAGLELDADGGLGVEAELVAGEAGEDLRLAHRRVSDQHHLEDVVHLVSGPRHASAPVALAISAPAPGGREREGRLNR